MSLVAQIILMIIVAIAVAVAVSRSHHNEFKNHHRFIQSRMG